MDIGPASAYEVNGLWISLTRPKPQRRANAALCGLRADYSGERMGKISKIKVAEGIFFVSIPDADVYILCGCPADSVKHLMKKGLIVKREERGVVYETGPNAILLSDVLVQNGSFSNLAEFPVLQMLYRQGMLLPDHPKNTGAKPLLIGSEDQVQAQLRYIHRGNYGLVSEEEIRETGIDAETAREMMALKLILEALAKF